VKLLHFAPFRARPFWPGRGRGVRTAAACFLAIRGPAHADSIWVPTVMYPAGCLFRCTTGMWSGWRKLKQLYP